MSDQEQPQAEAAPAAPATPAPTTSAPTTSAPTTSAPTTSSRPYERRSGPRGPRSERRGKFSPRPKVCQFCVEKTKKIDYKAPEQLRRFVSDRGKIRPRRQTGTCARHQRHLAVAIKRARHLALLPFVGTQAR
jgi:small subunit ribosomal protein S18